MKNKMFVYFIIIIVCLLVTGCSKKSENNKELLVHCTLCMKTMYEDFVQEFTKQTGIKVILSSVPDGQMINQLKINPEGDIVQVGASFFMDSIKEHVEDVKPVCIRDCVIVAAKGNPGKLHSINDFGNPGVKAVICDVDTSGMGKVCKKMFDKVGNFDQVKPNIISSPKSSAMMMLPIRMGEADGGICWRDVTVQWIKKENAKGEIEIIEIDKNIVETDTALIAVLKNTKNKDAAHTFMTWVLSAQRETQFISNGFATFLGG